MSKTFEPAGWRVKLRAEYAKLLESAKRASRQKEKP